ncbi:hypothetical protein K438DRAFT_1765903 [Mycena galopus ATCC 62051]|nr:hypothetical protein K438DRAFT_1765903 [Mycena galopus ATCC 62051]
MGSEDAIILPVPPVVRTPLAAGSALAPTPVSTVMPNDPPTPPCTLLPVALQVTLPPLLEDDELLPPPLSLLDEVAQPLSMLDEVEQPPPLSDGSTLLQLAGECGQRIPIVHQALGVEIVAMGSSNGLEYMVHLGQMHTSDLEWENTQAETRAQTALLIGQRPLLLAALGSMAVTKEQEGVTPMPLAQVSDNGEQGEPPSKRPQPKPAWHGAQAGVAAKAKPMPTPSVKEKGVGEPVVVDPDTAAVRRSSAASEEVPDDEETEKAKGGKKSVDGGEGEQKEDEGESPWELDDDDRWPEQLQMVFGAFKRIKDLGSADWAFCVRSLIELECARGFSVKGLVAIPTGTEAGRPEEVPDFMKCMRKWERQVPLTSAFGPSMDTGTFGNRWWTWWTCVQPESRMLESGKLMALSRVGPQDWTHVSKMNGRNGIMLYVATLLWWGEAAVTHENAALLVADWKIAVRDVGCVLVMAWLAVIVEASLERMATSAAENFGGKSKRKQVDRTAEEEKENVPAKTWHNLEKMTKSLSEGMVSPEIKIQDIKTWHDLGKMAKGLAEGIKDKTSGWLCAEAGGANYLLWAGPKYSISSVFTGFRSGKVTDEAGNNAFSGWIPNGV